MKVIELCEENQKLLKEFSGEIADSPTRPALYIGFDAENNPVLHLCDMTWKELAHIKVAFEMHVARDWLGLMERD